MNNYGKILVGNYGIEFYDNRDLHNYIQIPWSEVDIVIASVMFRGKWIPRFSVKTKKNGLFTFSAKNPKKVLRMVRKYVGEKRIVRSLTFFQVLKRNLKNIIKKK